MSSATAVPSYTADTSINMQAHANTVDPSTVDGSHVLFDRDINLEVRHSEDVDTTLGILLTIKIKILVQYNKEDNQPESVRIELSRDDDIFFYMFHTLQEKGFSAMRARQKLMIEFADYPHMLITNFNKCIKDSSSCMAVLYIHRDGNGRMDFIQNMEFKFVELLSVDFQLTPSDIIKQHIIFRYFNMKTQVDLLQARLADVNELVRTKSPSLLLQIKRTPLRGAQSHTASSAGKTKSPLALLPGTSPTNNNTLQASSSGSSLPLALSARKK